MSLFDKPLSWFEALAELERKKLLPSHLSSREMRQEFGPDILNRSIFSARNVKAQILQVEREQVAALVNGETNIATARAKVQDALDRLSYHAPSGGFPDDPVEPAEQGSLRDLASDARVDLVVRTNMQQVTSAADAGRAMGDDELYWFPCYELKRVASRLVPRGMRRAQDGGLVEDAGKDWPSRWEKVGGKFYDGRMIARKDDPIWEALGSSANFDDALDTSFEPYAFNSGFGRVEIPRRECLALGILDESDRVSPVSVRVNEGLAASIDGIPAADLEAIRKDLQTSIEARKLRLKAMGFDLSKGRNTKRYRKPEDSR